MGSQKPITVGTAASKASLDTNFGNTQDNFTEIFGRIESHFGIEDSEDAIISGTVGSDAAYKIPFEYKRPTSIEFEMQFPFDVHSGAGRLLIAAIVEAGSTTPIFKVGVDSTLPTAAPYIPNYLARLYTYVGATERYGVAGKLETGLNKTDAFSIRKVAPTAADLLITLEVTDVHVRLSDNGTPLYTWLFADHATIQSMISAMQTDLGVDYEVKNHYADGHVPSDLACFVASLCKSQLEYDIPTLSNTAVTIYDSYETYVPIKDVGIWHKIKIIFETHSDTTTNIWVYIDGDLQIYDYYAALAYSSLDCEIYLNHSPDGADTPIFAPIRNLKILHYNYAEPRFLVGMCHNFIAGVESDGIAPGGDVYKVTSGRLKRFFSTAKRYGWTFITMSDFIKMYLGAIPAVDKVIVMTTDDNGFGYNTVEAVRLVHQQNNIKQTTAIITDSFDFVTNQATIDKLLYDGNSIGYHADVHLPYEFLSYAQFVAAMANSNSAFNTANYRSNVLLYSSGSVTTAQQKWYLNNGFAVGFISGGGVGIFKNGRFRIYRQAVDDVVPFATLEALLSI